MKKTQDTQHSEFLYGDEEGRLFGQSHPHVWNSMNVRERETPGQGFNLPSLTVPDQAMSMRTLMERYASGQPLLGTRTPIFEEDDEPTSGINPKTMDLYDLQELQDRNAEKIKNLTTEVKEAKNARKAAFEEKKSEIQKLRDEVESLRKKTQTDGGGTNTP